MAEQLRYTPDQLSPGFSLEKWINSYSKLFVGTRYSYEVNSTQAFDADVLMLAPHLDRVLGALLAAVEVQTNKQQ
uniref:hypothetical protein n=1 Tax=Pseudomonas syringae TaxID=317 RepID=UPI00155DD04C|nr:hypothetical protein [Pseudomonas syringae]